MQSRHRYRALQAVEPKCEVSVVFCEPHWGQGTTSDAAALAEKRTTLETSPVLPWLPHCGGAMP